MNDIAIQELAQCLLLNDQVLVGFREWWIGWGWHPEKRTVTVCGFTGPDFFDKGFRQETLEVYVGKRMNVKAGNVKVIQATDAMCLLLDELGLCYSLEINKRIIENGTRFNIEVKRVLKDKDIRFLKLKFGIV